MKSTYNKFPSVKLSKEFSCSSGWEAILAQLNTHLQSNNKSQKIIAIEFYHGVDESEITDAISKHFGECLIINSNNSFRSEKEISTMVFPDVTDDRVFGFMTKLELKQFLDTNKIEAQRKQISQNDATIIFVIGMGATLVCPDYDVLIYADMPRWEIQNRFKKNLVDNLGVSNKADDFPALYKQAYFVDWRVLDNHKRTLMQHWDFVLDTTVSNESKMLTGKSYLDALSYTNTQPFSVVPFFDPGPWGGQWMKEVCDLDKSAINYAWSFNGVPEENSLLFQIGDVVFETPSINLVFFEPVQLLGTKVYKEFGAEFPIRFDFLDTMGGGNLSLQVHPSKAYIKEQFGVEYTQDESYYMMDVGEGAFVYLGFKEGVDKEAAIANLEASDRGEVDFDAEKYVEKFPVKKHDHILIPAGTIHCSGAESMVLEISATPYIFTFKLWDWGRLGMDGKPRPINVEHGKKVLELGRTSSWTKKNLVNRFETLDEGDWGKEEKTGLHELEFIETRRHWFSTKVNHHTNGNLNVLCLVEGEQALVESPSNAFEPFVVNYAEVFIVPAAVGAYTITPNGESRGKQLATMKAFVRV